jgi:ABC-type lipoprotein release transport system permease subunit
MSVSFQIIKPLLQAGSGKFSRWFSFIGMGIGVLLLLCSIQMFTNIQQLLKGNTARKNGFDYIAVTKKVTNESMGQTEKNLFTESDIVDLKSKSFIEDVAPLVATDFKLELSGGTILPFSTDLFLESIRPDFLDTLPPDFQWQEGKNEIPLIVSSDFLEVFNVFAPAYGYSQISRETASGIPVVITCYGAGGIKQDFTAKIVAFTDRINSTLAPLSFIEWANEKFGGQSATHYSRLYIKTKDANDPAFLNFLEQKGYEVNKEKTRFGRAKQVLQGVISGLGLFGLMVVILAFLLFSFYLQLVIAKSKENLQLLLALGYSPKWLGKKITGQLIPVYSIIIVLGLLITQVLQYLFQHFVMDDRPGLSPIVSIKIIGLALLLFFLSFLANYRLVRNSLYKL